VRAAHVALLLTLALAAGGCTGSPVEATTPTQSGDGAAPWMAVYAECMRDKGWDARVQTDPQVGDPGVVSSFNSDQQDAFMADSAACHAAAGVPTEPPSFSEADAGHLYDIYLGVASCVIAAGYDVPAAPSREFFVYGMMHEGLPPWTPYDGLLSLAPADYATAKAACPIPDWP